MMSSKPAALEPANSDPNDSARDVNPKMLRRWLIVTTTASPARASLVPSTMRPEPDPVEKPPPCSHTMTGRFAPLPSAGVNTFSTRQSSLSAGAPVPVAAALTVWGAVEPNASASRVPVHGAGLVGGMKRFLPDVVPP